MIVEIHAGPQTHRAILEFLKDKNQPSLLGTWTPSEAHLLTVLRDAYRARGHDIRFKAARSDAEIEVLF
ncbi:MAG: hypothetical protein HC933_00250 [Pleurocapsa sp. SU_196_0]|nr:hypothetical protein [Pleurocapsa sp. SU_196_0]